MPHKAPSSRALPAGIISLPILVFIGDIIGVMGGFLICTNLLNFNPTVYLQNTFNFVQFIDVFSGLVKASVFGFIITFMGCYHGFNASGGAQGVGQSTTYSVDDGASDKSDWGCSYDDTLTLLHGGEGWATGNTVTASLEGVNYTIRVCLLYTSDAADE